MSDSLQFIDSATQQTRPAVGAIVDYLSQKHGFAVPSDRSLDGLKALWRDDMVVIDDQSKLMDPSYGPFFSAYEVEQEIIRQCKMICGHRVGDVQYGGLKNGTAQLDWQDTCKVADTAFRLSRLEKKLDVGPGEWVAKTYIGAAAGIKNTLESFNAQVFSMRSGESYTGAQLLDMIRQERVAEAATQVGTADILRLGAAPPERGTGR